MKKTLLLAWVLLAGCATRPALSPAVRPDPAGIETTLLLIGDAGEASAGDPVMAAVAREVGRDSASTTVVFVGDNIYPSGLPDINARSRQDAERRLNAQVAAARAANRAFFIPGNHDWAWGQDDGWQAVERQGDYLAETGVASARPERGCPGPDVVDLGPHLRLLLLDTQWWLARGRRLRFGENCSTASPDTFVLAIESAIQSANGRHVVVAGHHPMQSSGPHGGRFGWKDHIFPLRAMADWAWIPLPIIGSIYPLSRKAGISGQDLSSTANETLRAMILAAFDEIPPLVYVAGHEHGLEVHRGPGARYTLVSGAGSIAKLSELRPRKETPLAVAAAGFMRLDAYADGRVRLTVITVEAGGAATDVWSEWLQ